MVTAVVVPMPPAIAVAMVPVAMAVMPAVVAMVTVMAPAVAAADLDVAAVVAVGAGLCDAARAHDDATGEKRRTEQAARGGFEALDRHDDLLTSDRPR
jgi:hypothetical protein